MKVTWTVAETGGVTKAAADIPAWVREGIITRRPWQKAKPLSIFFQSMSLTTGHWGEDYRTSLDRLNSVLNRLIESVFSMLLCVAVD